MKYGLVVDLGATNLRVALVNDGHEILSKEKVSTDKRVDLAFQIFNAYKKMESQYELEKICSDSYVQYISTQLANEITNIIKE